MEISSRATRLCVVVRGVAAFGAVAASPSVTARQWVTGCQLEADWLSVRQWSLSLLFFSLEREVSPCHRLEVVVVVGLVQ